MTTYNKNASHSFAFLPSVSIRRNVFNRSHEYKTTLDSGYLVPVLVDEVLPGDTFTLNSMSVFSRINTLIVPVMDNLYLEAFAWFVPCRIIWDNFKRFMGEQRNPGDSTDYLIPQLKAPSGGFKIGSVADYFGIPTGVENISVNALPFRGLNLIYNEWYRDENLQNSLEVEYGDGPDSYFVTNSSGEQVERYPLFRRGKRKDYFTSCLPSPQKGDRVILPLGESAPVIGNGIPPSWKFPSFTVPASPGLTHLAQSANYNAGASDAGGTANWLQLTDDPTKSGFIADLRNATAASITEFRQCIQTQAFKEIDARSGTRYTEKLRGHFGVISPDARLQRPELLAVSSSSLNINTVPQTNSTDSVSPQANLAAYGVFSQSSLSFSKSFTEHGYIYILVNIRADLTYQQGIDRLWSRKTMLDFFWPILANTSEQPVFNKELFAQGNEDDDGIFGYQERAAEYRYFPSKITGKLRSNSKNEAGRSDSLDVWHLSQNFESLPKLNSEFIEDNPPVERIVAVQDEPQFVLDAHFDLTCARPIPLFGIPGSLGVHL